MNGVLVLDGRQRSALAITRSLGRRGIPIFVADCITPCLAGRSRHAQSQHCYPDPTRAAGKFVDWVTQTARALHVEFIFPATDTTTMLLAPIADQLGSARLLCAQAATYELVSDKSKVLELARQAGISAPITVTATTAEEIFANLDHCTFPVVIKPARSKASINGNVVSTSVLIAQSKREAVDGLTSQPWLGHVPCLLQQYIEGHGAGIFTLFANDQSVAWFAHRRIREKPPTGGVSVLSEGIEPSAALIEASHRLLRAAQWNGLAMLEFKVAQDGTAHLMEINGRPWGSLQLAIDSGVDFPWLLYEVMTTGQVVTPQPYPAGHRLRWLLGDVDNLLIHLKDRQLGLAKKLRTSGNFLATFLDFSCRQEIFRWSDPAPAILELRSWVKALR